MNMTKGYCECGCGKLTLIAKRNNHSKGIKKGEPARFIHGHNGRKDGKSVNDPAEYQREWAKKKREKIRASLSLEEIQKIEENRQKGRFKKGAVPWIAGKKGLFVAWNKGMTKETDERIMEAAKKVSTSVKKLWENPDYQGGNKKGVKFNLSDEQREQYSEGLSGEGNPMHGMSGEKSPVWMGGVSFLPYPPEFNNKLKHKIKKRDNFTCQLCGIKQYTYQAIHHIDYEKDNCSESNLITLCLSCNVKVNQNRDFWKQYFTEIINKGRNINDLPKIRYRPFGAELKPLLNNGKVLTCKDEDNPRQAKANALLQPQSTERRGTLTG